MGEVSSDKALVSVRDVSFPIHHAASDHVASGFIKYAQLNRTRNPLFLALNGFFLNMSQATIPRIHAPLYQNKDFHSICVTQLKTQLIKMNFDIDIYQERELWVSLSHLL